MNTKSYFTYQISVKFRKYLGKSGLNSFWARKLFISGEFGFVLAESARVYSNTQERYVLICTCDNNEL